MKHMASAHVTQGCWRLLAPMMGSQLRLHHSLHLQPPLQHFLRLDHPWECGSQPSGSPIKIDTSKQRKVDFLRS